MIIGHFNNKCFGEMLKCLKPGGHMVFTIRDIYLNYDTDNGMRFQDALADLVAGGEISLLA